ncbi:ribose/xylose/arabinose/galactoside ABC-type transport system permease subunit [Rhizobium pisi]
MEDSGILPQNSSRPGGSQDATFHPRQSGITLGLKLLSLGPLLILIMLIAVVSLITPAFLKPTNLGNILAQTAVIAVVAMGQQLVILTRGIDLSVGSNLALATVIGGLVYQQVDSSIVVIVAMLLAGAAVGAVNGVVFVYGRLPHPFIITLASLSICRGLALALAPGHTTMRGMATTKKELGTPSVVPPPIAVTASGIVRATFSDPDEVDGLWPMDLCGRPARRMPPEAWVYR